MNILTKLLALFKPAKPAKTASHYDGYRKELNDQNLTSFEDLLSLLRPLLRNATKLEVHPPSKQPPENAPLLSHFGGLPYFEAGGQWPTAKNGKHLEFVLQIFNNGQINLPDNIKLVQFFYGMEEFAFDTESDGWLIKIYETLNTASAIQIDTPAGIEQLKYCNISFKAIQSLPDWEGLNTYHETAAKLSCILNESKPWHSYQKAIEQLTGQQNYSSQIGGYPCWVQGESTPVGSNGQPMPLLFQIDSEDNAGLMWGDMGLVYFFYDGATKQTEFALQCS